jgi:hypothetical protein
VDRQEIEQRLTEVIKPTKQLKTRGLHLYDLLGKGAHLKLQNAKRNQIHKNTGSVGGDANAVLALAYRRHGNGCKAIAEKIGASSHTYVAQIFRSLDLGALPMEEQKNHQARCLTEEERAQRIYEESWMREVRSVRNGKTWAKHPAMVTWATMFRYKNEPEFRFKHNLRARLRVMLKKTKAGKKVSAVRGLGVSPKGAMQYLEARFRDGMTWDNMGSYWEIDHVKPLASYDLSKKSEQLKASHYTNLQPLLVLENRIKSDKYHKQGELNETRSQGIS